MGARVVEALLAIAAAHPARRVLVVTHGGPMRAVSRGRRRHARASRTAIANCDVDDDRGPRRVGSGG